MKGQIAIISSTARDIIRSNSLEFVRQRSKDVISSSAEILVDRSARPFYRLHSHFFIEDLQKAAVKGSGGYFLISSNLCMLCRDSLTLKPMSKNIKIHPELSFTSVSKRKMKKKSRRCSLQHHHDVLEMKPHRKGVLHKIQSVVKSIKRVFKNGPAKLVS